MFGNLSQQERQEAGSGFDMGGGDFEPIPNNTQLAAIIQDATWDVDLKTKAEYVKLKWQVIDGEYKNRVIFHKVRINNDDSNKAAKALQMLFAIDSLCGGQLAKSGSNRPDDADLTYALANKPMAIKVMIWQMTGDDGEKKSGNWVKEVGALNPRQQQSPQQAPRDLDDDIPF